LALVDLPEESLEEIAAKEAQRETPLDADHLLFLAEPSHDPLGLVEALINRKQPH